ncbi:DUF551 domain-containing protein [Escherichia coli]|nr:DUF551 domain-containing protein [Escherichia coli]EER2784064.1 DUF551 domain-containing protein [Escherichia coli]
MEEALRDKQALLEASEKRIAELEAELVSQTYKLPHTQFEQIANLYEMQFDDGRTCAFHTDAQKAEQWLQACDGNRVQEYVKLERLQNALSGNSPVTPDGWISCSERMPEKYDFDIWVFSPSRGVLDGLQWDGSMFTDDEYQFVIHDATHWMRKVYPAAPQQDGE